MKSLSTILILFFFLFCSCSKDPIKIDTNNLLLGVWNYKTYRDNSSVYTRSQEFASTFCYRFNSDGTLIERKNSGWCGTPPISYADYSGNWTILNDTLIQISVGYWGGSEKYNLDIESISSDSLQVIRTSVKK